MEHQILRRKDFQCTRGNKKGEIKKGHYQKEGETSKKRLLERPSAPE